MPFLYPTLPNIMERILRFSSKLIFSIFSEVKIFGLENLPEKGPIIFASNHGSELDVLLFGTSAPAKFIPYFFVSMDRGLYKRSGWRQIFYGGFIFDMFGAYKAMRGTGDYAKSLSIYTRVLTDGHNVFIFPEGQRTLDGKLQRGRGGVSFLATQGNVPIIPVGISGNFNVRFFDFILRKRKFKVSFGKPIHFSKEESNHSQNAEKVMAEIGRLLR